jgi:arylsulfatase A-like enzyme
MPFTSRSQVPIRGFALAALFAASLLSTPSAAADSSGGRPNVILIVTDDHGYADVGVHGCTDVPTPNLDALANSGIRCSDGYVCCPVCSPSRAGLLTGRYPQRAGFEFNPGGPKYGLDPAEKTIAELLAAEGYAAGLVGKWHLGTTPQFHPNQRGFAHFYGTIHGAHHYLPTEQVPPARTPSEAFIDRLTARNALQRNGQPMPEPDYLTDEFARQSIDFIARHQDQPFFLFVSFNAVHVPHQASPKYLERFASIENSERRTYAAMLSAVDDAVGAIRQKLADEKLDDRTLVFFLSDNGGPNQPGVVRNDPLRGAKSSVWEGGIRVPFFASWKGTLPAGKVYSQPVISLDILPTVLAAAGISPPAKTTLDGVNLIPHWKGEIADAPHTTLYWRYGDERALRHGSWKLINPPGGNPALFDLAEDVSETRDLAVEKPELVTELVKKYDAWSAEMQPPRWQSGFGKLKKKK